MAKPNYSYEKRQKELAKKKKKEQKRLKKLEKATQESQADQSLTVNGDTSAPIVNDDN
ncbi:hypothetical protein [Desulfogranum marinum]|uniref:hypothetical protein n=1 Tax=Desulfogranum marinum TaxID=453220 RepID=UPI0029C82AD4|nr:hypothetical protein [Desulfogranum marinum]